jgi:hypothetical protein
MKSGGETSAYERIIDALRYPSSAISRQLDVLKGDDGGEGDACRRRQNQR